MKKVAIVFIYFGRPKPFFSAFLSSAKENETIDFFFGGMDREIIPDYPNFHYFDIDLASFKNLLEKYTGENDITIYPYKTSEYRPCLGLIFQDMLKSYDYWGTCDPDVILGDIRRFLDPVFDNNYERILELGHLSFYKNEKFVNELFLTDQKGKFTGYSFRFVSHCSDICHFDEMAGVNPMWANFHIDKWYRDNHIFSDIKSTSLEMKNSHYRFSHRVFYHWKGGRLFEYLLVKGKCFKREMLYVHYQRRTIDTSKYVFGHSFYFVKNKFVPCISKKKCLSRISLFKRFNFRCHLVFLNLILRFKRFFFFGKAKSKKPNVTFFNQLPSFTFSEYISSPRVIDVDFGN